MSPDEDLVETFDVEQRSDEWRKLRCGIPTASMFSSIIAGGDGKMRAKAMRSLAGEILTGEPAETFQNGDMLRGVTMEQDARDFYARTRFIDLQRVGFVRRTIKWPIGPGAFAIGSSPDALIGENKLLEIKTMRPDLIIEIAEKGARYFPTEHRAQVQGSLWVTGRDIADLMIFYRGMPIAPTFTIERDDAYIASLRDQIESFVYDLDRLVERLRGMAR